MRGRPIASQLELEFPEESAAGMEIPTVRIYRTPAGNVVRPVTVWLPVDPAVVNQYRQQHEVGEINLEELSMPGDFRAREQEWLQSHWEELEALYRGEWILVDGAELVGHGMSLADALAEAEARGYPNPFVTAVPAKPRVNVIY